MQRKKFLLAAAAAVPAMLSGPVAGAHSPRSKKKKASGNPVVHFEIGCNDVDKTSAFYSSLFGWSPTPAPMASYLNTNSAEGIQGHITSLGHDPRNYVTFYIQVEHIAGHLENIVKAGGQKVVGPIPLPGGQQFAWFKDLDGNIIGLLTKSKS